MTERIRAAEQEIEELRRLRGRRTIETDIAQVYRMLIGGVVLIALQLMLRPAVWQWVQWPCLILASILVVESLALAVIAWSTYGWTRTALRDWYQCTWEFARTPVGAYRDVQRVKAIVRLRYEVEWLTTERTRVLEEEREGVRREREVRRYDRRAAEVGLPDKFRQQVMSAVQAGHAEEVSEYLADVRELNALYARARDLGTDFHATLVAYLRPREFDVAAGRVFVETERTRRTLLAEAHALGITDVTRADLDAGKEVDVRTRMARAREVAARRAALDHLHERIQRLLPEHRSESSRLLGDARTTVEYPRAYRKAHHTLSCSIDHAETIEARGRRRHRM